MPAADNQAAAKACKRVPKPSLLRGQTEFTLVARQIDNSKVSDIAAILKTNTSLTYLGFKGWVGDSGAQAIATSLKDNTTLKTLSFDSTRVSYRGVVALGRAVSLVNCPLTHLSLMYCPIGDKEVLHLIEALAYPTCCLHILRLDFCPDITDISGELIFKTLLDNRTSKMEVCGLKGTSVNEDLRRTIRLLLLPGGRALDKKVSPSCEAAAYFSMNFSVKKSELTTLHGLAKRVGPLSSTTTLRANTTLPPQADTTRLNCNLYKKYAYTSKSNKNSSHSSKETTSEKDEEAAINFVHAKNQLKPLLLDKQKRKHGASTSNIKMLLKLNSQLAQKMKK